MSETGGELASGWITFGRVEIDLSGRRLFVDAVVAPLEPKAFSVLELLARQPGRVFTRDEILDAVWGHRHVTPGVLNRIVNLLRHALHETAEQPHYLNTVHGVGYRLDAPARFSTQREPADGATGMEGAAPAPTPVSATPVPATPACAPQSADKPPFLVTARRLWLASAIALAAVAAVMLWPRAVPRARTPAPPSTGPAPMLVVLPLQTVDGGQAEAAFAAGLSEELTTRLAHIQGLTLISQTSAAIAQERKLDLAQLARELHVDHAVEGSLRTSGGRLRIDLRLIEVPGGKTLWAQDYDRRATDVFAIQGEIAQAVAHALALRLNLPTAAEGSKDAAVYRTYLELRSTLMQVGVTPDDARRHDAARTALRALIARAPDDAQAHGLLARSLTTQIVNTRGASATELAEAAREASRAVQLDPDNADAHDVQAELACRRMDWEVCMTEYRKALALDPTDVVARSSYAFRLAGIGYLDAALGEVEIADRTDPLNAAAIFSHARVLDTLGRHDDAKKTFDVLLELDPALRPGNAYARWYNAIWRHDYAEAQECAEQMPANEGFRASYLAVTAALQDASLWPHALQEIETSERFTGRNILARLLGPHYDAKAIFGIFQSWLAAGNPSYFMLVWQPEYAALRRTAPFQDYLRNTHILDYWRTHGFPPQCKPAGDGASCG